MTPVLGFLLALLAVEGLLLTFRPRQVKAILGDSPDKMLRIIGIAELVVVAVILAFVCKLL